MLEFRNNQSENFEENDSVYHYDCLLYTSIKKGIRYLKHYGVRGFYARLLERFEEREVEYQEWYEKNKPSEEELARQRKKKWKEPVTISVLVPAYRTPEVFLRQMIESVLNQTYPHLELCIADGSGEDVYKRQF